MRGPLLTVLARETATIPFVFVIASHPVEHGEAESVARPGRNITGFPAFEFSMGGKWLGLLKEIAPSVVRAGIVFNPETAPYAYKYMPLLEAAARSLSVSVTAAPVRDTEQLKRAVGELGGEPGGGLIVIPDTFTIAHRGIMIGVAAQHRLPAFYPFRLFVADGGLFITVLKASNFTGARHRTWTASYGVQAQPRFQSNTRPNLSWSSI